MLVFLLILLMPLAVVVVVVVVVVAVGDVTSGEQASGSLVVGVVVTLTLLPFVPSPPRAIPRLLAYRRALGPTSSVFVPGTA